MAITLQRSPDTIGLSPVACRHACHASQSPATTRRSPETTSQSPATTRRSPGTTSQSPATTRHIDVHQHLWPAAFLEALRRRTAPPRLDGWMLLLDGEPPYRVDPQAHDLAARSALEIDGGADVVVLGLSSPLGIEDLPATQASGLLAAWHEGVADLPSRFRGWASIGKQDPDLGTLKALLAGDFVGLQIPATRLHSPAAVESIAPILHLVEQADRPVLVHPGAVATTAVSRSDDLPPWWAPVVDDPAQLQAAWWSWLVVGRSLLPELRICFAAAAGLAPVYHERYSARGGGGMRIDPLIFVDTSSYGRQGLDSVVRVIGIDQLVLGSDRPYAHPADPGFGDAATRAIRTNNPQRFLEGTKS